MVGIFHGKLRMSEPDGQIIPFPGFFSQFHKPLLGMVTTWHWDDVLKRQITIGTISRIPMRDLGALYVFQCKHVDIH